MSEEAREYHLVLTPSQYSAITTGLEIGRKTLIERAAGTTPTNSFNILINDARAIALASNQLATQHQAMYGELRVPHSNSLHQQIDG